MKGNPYASSTAHSDNFIPENFAGHAAGKTAFADRRSSADCPDSCRADRDSTAFSLCRGRGLVTDDNFRDDITVDGKVNHGDTTLEKSKL